RRIARAFLKIRLPGPDLENGFISPAGLIAELHREFELLLKIGVCDIGEARIALNREPLRLDECVYCEPYRILAGRCDRTLLRTRVSQHDPWKRDWTGISKIPSKPV